MDFECWLLSVHQIRQFLSKASRVHLLGNKLPTGGKEVV